MNFDTDTIRNKLRELVGDMPLARVLRGEESLPTVNSLRERLTAMPVFDQQSGAQGAYDAAMNIGPMGLGKIVYHGSPHKFDKFDASKIGTGEGAQAYGHGIYLADAEDIGKRYRDTLTHYNPDVLEAKLIESGVSKDTANTYAQFAAQTNGAKVSFDKFSELVNGKSPIPSIENFRAARRAELPKVKGVVDGLEGSLYKADLPDEWIPKMLDWDKPLPGGDITGEQFYRRTVDDAGKQIYERSGPMWDLIADDPRRLMYRPADVATMALQKQGIPGIRYLDGGSRGAGQGSYNYVVFPGLEDKVKILERNGQPVNALLEMSAK